MSSANKLAGLVAKINQSGLPSFLRESALSLAFNSQVKMAGVAGIHIESLTESQSVLHLKNRFRVQNHIGGVHACGMALLAESASGVVFGVNVKDTHLPLLKSMSINYVKRAHGDLKAVATLTPEQREAIQRDDKGNLVVDVVLTDEKGEQPVECQMTWAWTPKKRSTKP
ncbi:hypothetical protein H257_13746 [Aphanomyces astaci]|uniref:DUF4442 domain-containing protein n=1 Tax=Aphanomyces astaci TaxID=112090 RepID=W4FW35_APHAT|nr:hypothetical protein H257_13746 [Aphanomyces astaci]ETV71029.1 hypothetical protein H257_13746 [Aphanomyces astaci]RQM24922.1 hypothetical protein B5M09_002464 [Aphanomyces astaci]|eukprot:XP_009839692.1 hypothetical protein H257_13746 [Aphanomyces astaci]